MERARGVAGRFHLDSAEAADQQVLQDLLDQGAEAVAGRWALLVQRRRRRIRRSVGHFGGGVAAAHADGQSMLAILSLTTLMARRATGFRRTCAGCGRGFGVALVAALGS